MTISDISYQDLIKLRDEHFEKALHSDDEKVQAIFEAISLSKKLRKPGDNFHIWIEYKGEGLDVNGDEFTLVRSIFECDFC